MVEFKYESTCRVSTFNIIAPDAIIGKHVTIGAFNVIEDNCNIEKYAVLENHITLKSLTIIGESSRLENGVQTSGFCRVGKNCIVKQGVIIGRQVVILDDTFISPNVVFLYADHNQQWKGKQTTISKNVFIGSGCQILPGVFVANGVTIGAGSVVTKDLTEENSIYVGSPAKFIRKK